MLKIQRRFVYTMLIIVAIPVFSTIPFVSQGQGAIEGNVLDHSHGLSGVTMLLMTMDSTMLDCL
jgi:hypothetical protein